MTTRHASWQVNHYLLADRFGERSGAISSAYWVYIYAHHWGLWLQRAGLQSRVVIVAQTKLVRNRLGV